MSISKDSSFNNLNVNTLNVNNANINNCIINTIPVKKIEIEVECPNGDFTTNVSGSYTKIGNVHFITILQQVSISNKGGVRFVLYIPQDIPLPEYFISYFGAVFDFLQTNGIRSSVVRVDPTKHALLVFGVDNNFSTSTIGFTPFQITYVI